MTPRKYQDGGPRDEIMLTFDDETLGDTLTTPHRSAQFVS